METLLDIARKMRNDNKIPAESAGVIDELSDDTSNEPTTAIDLKEPAQMEESETMDESSEESEEATEEGQEDKSYMIIYRLIEANELLMQRLDDAHKALMDRPNYAPLDSDISEEHLEVLEANPFIYQAISAKIDGYHAGIVSALDRKLSEIAARLDALEESHNLETHIARSDRFVYGVKDRLKEKFNYQNDSGWLDYLSSKAPLHKDRTINDLLSEYAETHDLDGVISIYDAYSPSPAKVAGAVKKQVAMPKPTGSQMPQDQPSVTDDVKFVKDMAGKTVKSADELSRLSMIYKKIGM